MEIFLSPEPEILQTAQPGLIHEPWMENQIYDDPVHLRDKAKQLEMEQVSRQKKLDAELQRERDKNKLLHEELKKLRASYAEILQRHQDEQWMVHFQRKQNNILQEELEQIHTELQEEKERQKVLEEKLKKFTVSHDKLCQCSAAKVDAELQEENIPHEEPETLTSSNKELIHNEEADTLQVMEQEHDLQISCDEEAPQSLEQFLEESLKKQNVLHEQPDMMKQSQQEDDCWRKMTETTTRVSAMLIAGEKEEELTVSNDVTDGEDTGSERPNKTKKASLWKRIRHFLSNRKRATPNST